MNLEQHISQATNLIFFIPTAFVSIILNFKNGLINFKNAFFLIIFGVIGSIFGSIISRKLPVATLQKLFGIFLLIICLYEIFSYYKLYIKGKKRHTNF